jgi:O-antigen/teichoic acid export membrane protein
VNASGASQATVADPSAQDRETALAVRNTLKLGSALAVSMSVGLAVRIFLPRFLGPETFGELNFADAFTATAFVVLGLGIDTYIRKEVSVREEHANEFLGGALLLRAAMAALLFGIAGLVMANTRRPADVRALVYAYGGAQVVMSLNATLAATLHAHGIVGALSIANVLSKVAFALGVLTGFAVGHLALAVPLALLVTELGKAAVLFTVCRARVGLRLRVNPRVTREVLVASLPYYVNAVAITAYARIDVSVLSFLVPDAREIGWYGAAATLARLGLLVAPVLVWVLMPLFARAAARSEEELSRAMTRAMELILAVVVPASLLLALGADGWVRLVFGREFGPSVLSLRILAPIFLLTYVAQVAGIGLNLRNLGWTVTRVSLAGMVLATCANLYLVPRAMASGLGPGAGGVACALSSLATEAVVTVLLVRRLPVRLFDRPGVLRIARMGGACLAVALLHSLLGGLGPFRVLADAAAYLLLATLLGAIRWRKLLDLVLAARRPEASEP